ncbi:multicopper oxidase domain-containing protein [Agriterribacter sp.]|uniref:multicopper oxidase domain-containing protein n=1 Tax=Agriterribacter sp. TaxID=2821509 RepID=UPI002CAED43C|nr:multicopper oxidase domain-containing protein [Agriterribacter sp.]HRO46613.1 multicopper oxidase domain-containing protein [Agriterribacter sp.]
MKKILFLTMQLILLVFFAPGIQAQKKQTQVIYTCPMHPEVKMDKPGNCPKCGMTLVKKTIKTAQPKTVPNNEQPAKPKDTVPVKKEMKDMQEMRDMKEMDMKADTNMHMHDKLNMDHSDTDAANQIGGKVIINGGKTVRYDLYVTDTMVNYTGKHRHGLAVNGSIPAPPLIFTEGDTAEIYLHNMLKTETSFHWHGIILPNEQDGVPFLTTSVIPGGTTHLYKFKIVQNGTYWYHSHTGLQQQVGTYGALIFKSREDSAMNGNGMMKMNKPYTAELPLVLSDWTDEHPHQVQRRLRSANDWYAIKKGSVQSYAEAIGKGYFSTKVTNEWKRMNAMDVSDVYYEKFLSNGKPEAEAPQFKAGDKVRLRVVNGGSSSYFWLQYAGGKITVIANDGNDVVPVEVDRLIIGVAETYDVIVTIPDNMSYEFRSTPEDRSSYTSLWLGSGMKMPAPTLPKLKYFEGMKMMNGMMKMNGDMKPMPGMQMSLQSMDMNTVMYPEITGSEEEKSSNGMHDMPGMNMDGMKDKKADTAKAGEMHDMKAMDNAKMDTSNSMKGHDMQGMDMGSSTDIVTLNYAMLRSPVKTTLPDVPTKVLHFTLEGNMNRYVWSINNKTLGEWDKILIKQGEKVRIILTNNSMMRHPMHLHGHDFRVLGAQGEYAPFKNTIDIMPMETDTLEFAANKDGDWFFHCHILYHMMAGMGNVLSYQNSPPNPQLPDKAKAWKQFKRSEQMIHPSATIGLESNGSDATFMLSGNRYELQGLWHLGLTPEHGREVEVNFGRYLGKMQWLFPYVGFDYHYAKVGDEIEKNAFGQVSNKSDRKTFVVGLQYTLPMLVVADARVDGDGKFRFQLGREDIPLTNRLRLNMMWNTDKEYAAGLRYIVKKWFALSTHYDSDMGLGAGVTLIY